jgi:hypothetical protein
MPSRATKSLVCLFNQSFCDSGVTMAPFWLQYAVHLREREVVAFESL